MLRSFLDRSLLLRSTLDLGHVYFIPPFLSIISTMDRSLADGAAGRVPTGRASGGGDLSLRAQCHSLRSLGRGSGGIGSFMTPCRLAQSRRWTVLTAKAEEVVMGVS
ncbi:hypothetical protein B0H14DRAFT_3434129 [Mycena olivaceomarginata]|nr:hypothetical protein B0H14DRAFT_3434129 [Mycena olivaceomarginata]